MTKPEAAPKRAARPRLYFAGVVVDGQPGATVEDAQRILAERVARYALKHPLPTPAPAEAAD